MKLNSKQKQIHERALVIAIQYRKAEAEMVQILQEADRVQLHKSLGLSSLLKYAIKHLKLTEPVALAFIAVARKATEVPALKSAICEERLSVSTANRIVSTLTGDNASELIAFAASHSWRETEREIARRNPRAAVYDKVKMIGNGLVQLTISVSEEEYSSFQRVCSVEAQRKGKSPTRREALAASNHAYLDKYDPVRKAERAKNRSVAKIESAQNEPVRKAESAQNWSVRTDQNQKMSKSSAASIPANTGRDENERVPYTAAELHAVNLRDKGRCTHVDENGCVCNEDRWTEIHHIIPISQGGKNNIDNLTTLCSFHHDLAHQLSLPLEGQITWLRAPRKMYVTG